MPLNNMTVAISSEINAFTKNTGARPGSMDMSIPIYRAWTEELSRGDTSGNEYSLMSHLHNILSVHTEITGNMFGPGIIFYKEKT